ncbi:OmpA family protein [Pedobacter heparinus]|uniref:OmpA/MotB domain protein n=1 Tax=Pedobacter heparinus (strain ATCC 13125 / DSM 2366 / CIP 104194 / JCM 7457 / NBRC 12017 / NCIMB 9290 / NRRL B-14731 / HIM 762-3) TaxID=485917 RepID=C6XWX7_PEDHD|nr:OmpA family protein [Pedobacter heparinus]ACU04271.1 OmpA/MotB domain protein [Pedobacter heparinus DSM 2366]
MKKVTLLFFLCFILQIARAQTSTVKKAQNSFDKAQEYLRNNDYDQAIPLLQEAIKADPAFQFAFIQLADINRRQKLYEQAKINYTSAIALGGIPDARAYYGFAESQIYTGDYANALNNIKLFIAQYKGNDPDFMNRAKKYLRDCEFAIVALKQPVKYDPINMGPEINSVHRDYFPSVTADGTRLIFSRNINGNEDFFVSEKKDKSWSTPLPLSDKINTQKYNEGAQSISPDGLYLFFTGCNRPDGLGRCDIYVSHKNGKDWGEPFNLGAPVNTSYWESQPAISPDGSTLYFVSNRPGGLGGYDIWKSMLKADGYWSQPENLGPEINTPYDEHTPFIHPDGKTLYFSSDGWPGMGNKDIFMSRMNEAGKWSSPENLGYPINTFNEETGLIVTPDGTYGLFSSNLKGGYGDMDIYQFKMPENKKPLPITYVKGIVTDKESKVFLEAKVQVVNLKTKKVDYSDYTSKETGDFLAVMPLGGNYAFNVSADGYLFYSENYQLDSAYISKPYVVQVALEKLSTGKNMVLKNIFFNTNEYTLLPASLTELNTLQQLLKNNASLCIEIQGHTDNVGNDQQNERLSLQRAKAVYDYLVQEKIEPQRLTFKGYGENKPIAANDTDAHRRQNRRTSFIITKI